MTKLKIDQESTLVHYFDYSLEFECPYCHRKLSLNEQESPLVCECGKMFRVKWNPEECTDYPDYTKEWLLNFIETVESMKQESERIQDWAE